MLKRLYHLIAGKDETFGFEHRVFNLSAFIIVVFCVQGTLINYLLGLDMATVWLAVIGTFIAIFIYYRARIKGIFSQELIIFFSLSIVLILGPLHFFNGASYGPTIYLLIMSLNIFLIIASSATQVWIYAIFSLAILTMLLLEYFFPAWVVAYASPAQRITDHITTVIYSLFFTMITIRLFRRSYDREQSIILKQKKELEEAYHLTSQKNQHIESLIKELHHRVKNNLQVVSSLMSLQSRRLEDKNARLAMDEGKKRVDAMAMIHQKLYMDNELASVHIGEYLNDLAASLAGSFGFSTSSIITEFSLADTNMDIDRAVPIGLIVNELITNAFKHAFKETADPKVYISLLQPGENIELKVSDNGKGIQENQLPDSSLGMKLVKTLVNQLEGTMNIINTNGTTVSITIAA